MAVIAFQLALMQILSIVQWYHFAYMVISVALLGFGAAGTFLALFRKGLLQQMDWLLPLLMFLSGAATALAAGAAQLPVFRFDSYLLFANPSHVWRLLFTYLLFFIPFFFSALAIGLLFVKYAAHIGKLYFANLLGSGLGGIAALALMWLFFPAQLPAIIAFFSLAAGITVLPEKRKGLMATVAVCSAIVIIWQAGHPPRLILSQFKSLSKTLNLPEAGITLEKSSPQGFIQAVSSPALRYAPGLSLSYRASVPAAEAVFNNGNWFGAIIPYNRTDTTHILDYTTAALPYAIGRRERVLILNSATGIEAAQALAAGARQVMAVEPNSAVLSLLKNELAGKTGNLLNQPGLIFRNRDSRTFLLSDTAKYDLIALPMIGAFGGTSGLYALQEDYLLTTESLRQMRRRLTPGGVISISSWMDYPPRYPLKILATMAAAAKAEGISHPENYLAAVHSWGTITFVLKASPLAPEEIERTRRFCEKMLFDPALLPGLEEGERQRFNAMQDSSFFSCLDEILSPHAEKFYAGYDFNIRPASDDRPYFSQFLRWKSLPRLAKLFGEQALPFFEIGYLIVALTLAQITLLAIVLIILPLFRIGWKGGGRLRVLFYFSGIGLGYMFVEIIFIQRFVLYFGNPVYSAAAVIASILICSGVGSYFSSRWKLSRNNFLFISGAVIGLLLFYALVLNSLLHFTIAQPPALKIFLTLAIIAPLSFFMGMPFPLGIRMLAERNEATLPWAWGINGCVSVLSAALATIISVEMGFLWVMVLAALAYCLPLAASWKMGGG